MEGKGQIKKYRRDIDSLKGIAVLAVIFYHMGFMKNGYLGVDIFFVINGFLVVPSIYMESSEGTFNPIRFMKKRAGRLYPLLIVICAVSLFIGFFLMFPDDLNTLSELVIATLTFSNKMLSFYLCRDYWDWTNDFKPLMHTWYLGVLMQIYLFISLLLLLLRKKLRIKGNKMLQYVIWSSGIISVFLFLFPGINRDIKFYFFPFRLFEFCAGGCAGINAEKYSQLIQKRSRSCSNKIMYYSCMVLIGLLLVSGIWNPGIAGDYLRLFLVGITSLLLLWGGFFLFSDIEINLLAWKNEL